ncbi:hypothetical protein EMIHUDRAFT_233609 [Emiliania huxleyi CCMP1516]|uniref:Uncharacterized protein n=2 Tax=Emiliania huxleyi TaxID=2903 RepID=A0A0D3K1S4_EMIH1|nr:hypothetical protein EMIHUDRAFT_233609 [Emiliania huxleyi CCMP1516]EOD29709.1 hypothetical protein EMIHUDRAFT_233609 [Emiliania huxleyi CCMP1516]|eukprot:XP_005782138.1 hypothetical protein EMIHUDRAFT_233609 [Emiliania huxleyi CCMP1516]
MSSTDKLVIPAYKQSSEREFNEWFRNLRTAAKQHKYLLDIIEVGTIRPGAEREAEAVALHVRYKNIGTADGLIPAMIDKFFKDLSVTLSRQLYGALQNAVKDDDTLAEMLADEDADHYDDIKKGIAAIKSLIESEDTNSKNVRTKALRADLEKAYSPDALKDLTSASLAKFKTGIEQANKLLKDSQWHLPDEVIEEYILDAIAAKGATLGANMRVQIGIQRQLAAQSGKTYSLKASTLAMQGILDQDNADRANEAKAAAQAAFEAEIASQGVLKEKLAAAESQVAALQAQIKSDKGGGDRGGRAAAGRKPCPHCNGLHGGKCIGDLICKGVPVAKVLEELPDRIDHETKVRMAQSSYKKVCAKSPGRTLPHDPFKKSDSTATDHEEVRAALADSVTRTFDPDGIVGGFVAGVGTDQVEDTFPDSNPTDTPAILKAKTAARNAAEARARGGLWVKFTSFVTALPRPYIGASILLVLLACLIPVYMGSPASIGTPVADAVDEPSNMGVMVESVTALPLELSTGPATGSGGGAEYAIEEDPLQPIYRKVAGDMFRAVNDIDVPKTVPLVLSYTCIMLAMYVARMDAMQAHALVGHVKVVDAYDTTAGVNMPGSYAAGVDSKAGMNMFPTPDYFPHGWREPEKPIYIRCANNDYLKAKGVGTAYAFALADPTKPQDTKVVNTEWVNALYAPGLAMPLVSVKECKAQNIVVRFDLCPPRFNYPSGQTIYFGEDFNIHLMPLGASVGANAAKAIVRGKPGRRPTDGTFWRHALCISGDALKDLSKIADGVPDLSKMDRNEGLDDAALQANAKYHARRSTGRPLATRFGGSLGEAWPSLSEITHLTTNSFFPIREMSLRRLCVRRAAAPSLRYAAAGWRAAAPPRRLCSSAASTDLDSAADSLHEPDEIDAKSVQSPALARAVRLLLAQESQGVAADAAGDALMQSVLLNPRLCDAILRFFEGQKDLVEASAGRDADAAVGESYALLIYACVKLRRLDQAFVHFDTMVRRGLEPDPRVFAALLKGCGRARQLKRGERFFESLLDANAAGARSATAYNALINMYSHQKQRPATLLPHEEM